MDEWAGKKEGGKSEVAGNERNRKGEEEEKGRDRH